MNQLSQAASYKISDAFRICQRGKKSLISVHLDSKAKRKKKIEVKEARGGAGLLLLSLLYSQSSIWFSKRETEGNVFFIRLM